MTLNDLLARVDAGNDNETTEHRAELRRVVLETLAAVGLLVSARTGEVYDPAEGAIRVVSRNDQRLYVRDVRRR